MMARRRPTQSGLLLAFIFGMGAFFRFYALGNKTLWLDEAFSIWVAQHTLFDSWVWLIRIDQHPPLYYSLLHVWQSFFGDGQGAVRALSALCSTLVLPFFYGACKRWFDERVALIGVLLLAVSPFHIRYAQETRMYALLTLAAAATLYFLSSLLFAQPNKWRSWLGLTVAEAAVMLTHNTATVFFPLALNLGIGGALLWRYRRRGGSSLPALNARNFIWRWVGSQCAALILWAPWALPFAIQARGVDQGFWLGAPTSAAVFAVLYNFNLAFLPNWLLFFHTWDLLYWALAIFGVYRLRRTPARASLLLLLCVTPFIGELVVSLRRPIFYERTLIWASLPYYMLLAAGLDGLYTGARQRAKREPQAGRGLSYDLFHALAQRCILMLFVALSLLSLFTYYVYFPKEEWAQAAAYVAHHTAPNDLLLFNATWVQLPFDYYFRHYQTGATLRGLPVDLFDRGVLEPKMTEADVPYLRQLLAGRSQVWLIYSHDWYTDPNNIIPRELGQTLRQTEHLEFIGLQVFRYAAR